jgi:hypothetical protein
MPKSSTSFLFPDVNVWLALNYEGHVHHSVSKRWFEELDAQARLCFCRFMQLSLLRLVTTEAVMGRADVPHQSEVWRIYDHWQSDDPLSFSMSRRCWSRPSAPALRRLALLPKTGPILTWWLSPRSPACGW